VVLGYIARLKKEKEERETQQSHLGGPGYYGARGGYNAYRAAPKRGGYAYGSSRGSYHPYQRPQPPQKFAHKTAVFNKPEPTTTNETSHQPTKDVFSTPRGQQQIEPKTLCPALTSTGIFDETTSTVSFLSYGYL
jgi:hypothetical protein